MSLWIKAEDGANVNVNEAKTLYVADRADLGAKSYMEYMQAEERRADLQAMLLRFPFTVTETPGRSILFGIKEALSFMAKVRCNDIEENRELW